MAPRRPASTRPAACARATRATISLLASSDPRTRWRKRSAAWSVTAMSIVGSADTLRSAVLGADVERAPRPARVDPQLGRAGHRPRRVRLDHLAGENDPAAHAHI